MSVSERNRNLKDQLKRINQDPNGKQCLGGAALITSGELIPHAQDDHSRSQGIIIGGMR